MGMATARVAICILTVGRIPAYTDHRGVAHPPVVGLATFEVAQEWVAVTALLWVAALAARMFWERPERNQVRNSV
jgi:hypothetical protein